MTGMPRSLASYEDLAKLYVRINELRQIKGVDVMARGTVFVTKDRAVTVNQFKPGSRAITSTSEVLPPWVLNKATRLKPDAALLSLREE